jgi:hypothetical protein
MLRMMPDDADGEENQTVLTSVDGYWISAQVFTGDFSNSYFHAFPAPGRDVYATISLSQVNHYPTEPDLARSVSAYISWWTVYDADGKLIPGEPNSMGVTQNAVMLPRCGSLQFNLDVSNWVVATAQINIFQLQELPS